MINLSIIFSDRQPSFPAGDDFSYFCKFNELEGVIAHPIVTSFPSIKDSCYCPTNADSGKTSLCDENKDLA